MINEQGVDLSEFDVNPRTQKEDTENTEVDLKGFERANSVKLNSNLTESYKAKPEEQAEILQLSRKAGVPVEAVRSNKDYVKSNVDLKDFDSATFNRESPATSEFISDDVNNAIISRDDLKSGKLQSIEKSYDNLSGRVKFEGLPETSFAENATRNLLRRIPNLVGGLVDLASQAGDEMSAKFGGAILSAFSGGVSLAGADETGDIINGAIVIGDDYVPRYAGREEWNAMREQGTPDLIRDLGDTLGDVTLGFEERAGWENIEEAFARGDVGDTVGAGIAFAAEQGPASLVDMAATIYAMPAYLLARSSEMGTGRALNDNRDRAELMDSVKAAPFAIASAVLERILPAKIYKDLSADQITAAGTKMLTRATQNLSRVGKAAGSGLAIEASTEAVQSGIIEYIGETYGTETARDFKDLSFKEAGKQALQGAVAGGPIGATISAGAEAFSISAEKQAQVVEEQQTVGEVQQGVDLADLDNLDETIKTSKTKELDSETFMQFISRVDAGSEKDVYIDSEKLFEYLSTKKQKDIDADPTLKDLSERLNNTEEGVDVSMPMVQFAGFVSGTEHYAELRDHVHVNEESPTLFRQDERREFNKQYIDQIVAEAEKEGSDYVATQEVVTALTDSLSDTGQYTKAESKVVMTTVSAYLSRKAKAENKSVRQVFEEIGFTIDGPQTGAAARIASETALLQEPTDPSEEARGDDLSVTPRQEAVTLSDTDNLGANNETRQDSDVLNQQQTNEPSAFQGAISRTEAEADAEFARAKNGEEVAFVHRSFDDFDTFDNTFLGSNTTTPSAKLGFYLSAADVGNNDRYGNVTSVHKFTLNKPLIIDAETFELTLADASAEKIDSIKQTLMAEGHDGVLVNGVNYAIVFDAATMTKERDDSVDQLMFQSVENPLSTNPVIFKQEQNELDLGGLDDSGKYNTTTSGDVQPADDVQRRAIRVGRETVKEINVGSEKLDSVDKIALATTSLSNSAQEKLWVVAVDADGTPLEILNHTMGLKDSASADPTTIAGWAVSVKGATKVYLSHNHPSDDSTLSSADVNMANSVKNMLDGSGVKSMGIMAVTPDSFTHSDGTSGAIPEPTSAKKIKLVERTLERLKTKSQRKVDSPDAAFRIMKEMSNGEKGVLLLNNQHSPVGFLPFDFANDGAELRGGKLPTLLKAVESTNAAAVILNTGIMGEGEGNVANMLDVAGLRVLDALNGTVSAAQQGQKIVTGSTFKQEDSGKGARGYYDPKNSVIRLNESSDLTTFLHEFAHFMLETEINSDSQISKDAGAWFKRNAADVAAEANGYAGKTGPLEQQDTPQVLGDSGDVDAVQTGKPVTFNFIHNTESATGIFGKPKKGDRFGRDLEPSARFVSVTSEKGAKEAPEGYISGVLTFNNPLVVTSEGVSWKKEMSKKYGGKTGKKLSLAIIADGYDGIITTEDRYISETIDLTTFDEAKALYQEQDTPEGQAGEITAEDVAAYVDNKTTGDETKDSHVRRATHEQFARGYEAYLMEGKAPTVGLRNAFRQIAMWMVEAYKNMSLNVTLDDEMRQVFDRLLATEDQIEEARTRARMRPLFTDATMAGMSEEAFAKYTAENEKVKGAQTETLRDKLVAELTRNTEAWWKQERDDLIDKNLASLKNERVYVTANALKNTASTATMQADVDEVTTAIKAIEKEIKTISKSNDTVGKLIAKKGGLDRNSMQAEGVDPAEFKKKGKVFGKPLFPKTGGMSVDDVTELLNQEGFELDASGTLDLIMEMLDEDTTFVDSNVGAEVGTLYDDIAMLEEQISDIEGGMATINIKLDRATVKADYGEDRVDSRGTKSRVIPNRLTGMTATGQEGAHPDEVAGLFGYDSGGEMINELINEPTITDAAATMADKQMLDKHGDILNDGTIAKQADEAVQNDLRGEIMLRELKALNKGTRRPNFEREEIKQLAKDRIGTLSYRQNNPAKYRRGEIREAQNAAKFLAAGNKEAAANAKTQQAVFHYLALEATAARNETTKTVNKMSRYSKKKVREEIQKAQNGYWEQLVKVLNRFEFKKSATLKSVDERNLDINAWAAERMEVDGDALVLSTETLSEGYIKHWKDLPFSELQGVAASVANIEHVARYSNKIRIGDEVIDYKKYVNQWTGHIGKNAAKFDTKSSRGLVQDAAKETLGDQTRRWASQLTKIPYLASWLDGGERAGMSHDALMTGFNNALDEKLKLLEKTTSPIMELMNNRSKEDRARHAKDIYIEEIGQSIKGHQVLAVALNVGNKGNLRKLLLGEGWAVDESEVSLDNANLQAVLKNMTKTDWEFVQTVWDQMNTLYPQLAEVHRKTTGLVPPKIESAPVVTPFGTFNGGYYPVKYSPQRSHKADKNQDKADARADSLFSTEGSIQNSVTTSATQERTGFYDRIRLDINIVPEHFNETIHFITHHDAVRQLNKLIRDPAVEDAITAVLGEAEFKQLAPWLNDIAKDGKEGPTKSYIDEWMGRLRFGTTLTVMGFSASTGLMQTLGLFTTAGEVGMGHTYRAITKVLGRSRVARSFRRLFGSVEDMETGWEFAVARSKVLDHRQQTMDREIRNAMNRLKDQRGILAAVQEASMKHIAVMQTYMVDLPTWHAAYDKGVQDFGDEVRAAKYADWAVENLQGSGATKDMAMLMRNQSKLQSTFTMFMTFFSAMGNYIRDTKRAMNNGLDSPTTTASKAMFLLVIPVVAEMILRDELDEPEDEDERLSNMLTKIALYPVTSVPVVRDVVSGLGTDFGYNTSPVSSMLERGIMGTKQLVSAPLTDREVTRAALKNTTKVVGAALGIPATGQVWKSADHIFEVIEEGEDFTIKELLLGPNRN
jgi:hypothetical protein